MKNGSSRGDYGPVAINAALTTSMTKLPEQLRKTLRDQLVLDRVNRPRSDCLRRR